MRPDDSPLAPNLAKLAVGAAKSFLATIAIATVAGLALAAVSRYLLRDAPWFLQLVAVALALVESLTAGALLAIRRTMVLPFITVVGSLGMCRTFVRALFLRMPAAGSFADGLDRLPLAEAEIQFSEAVREFQGEISEGSWFRRKIQRTLLSAIHAIALARFREQGGKQGEVDISRVRQELETTIDQTIVNRLHAALKWRILLVVSIVLALVALQTWGMMALADVGGPR